MSSPGARQSRLPRLAVFISGAGRTLMNLQARCADGSLPAEIVLVVASRDCPGAAWARHQGIHTRVIVPNTITPASLTALLEELRITHVVLAGYLHLLPIPKGWERRIVNIHPALLPAFGGPGMHGRHVHEAVLAAGMKRSGATVHFCSDQYDQGPIIDQASCEVLPDDTPETLAARVFAVELELYPRALATLLSGAS